MLGEKSRQLAEELYLVRELLADVGTLHLDDHTAPVAKERGVDLAEARAPQRLLLERFEQLADASAQLLFDALFDLLEVHRRDIVLEVLELIDVRQGQEIRPRGEHLAQLDI